MFSPHIGRLLEMHRSQLAWEEVPYYWSCYKAGPTTYCPQSGSSDAIVPQSLNQLLELYPEINQLPMQP